MIAWERELASGANKIDGSYVDPISRRILKMYEAVKREHIRWMESDGHWTDKPVVQASSMTMTRTVVDQRSR